jgi:hypothetical protein
VPGPAPRRWLPSPGRRRRGSAPDRAVR